MYKSKGYNVYALCRKSNEDLDKLEVNVVTEVDVGEDATIEVLQKKIPADVPIHILINNAGILWPDNLFKKTETTIEDLKGAQTQFNINALGPIRVTTALLPNLELGEGKVMNVSTGMAMIGDNTSGGVYGYRMSKAALNMAGVGMSVNLKKKNIAVGMVNPGMVETSMTRSVGAKAGQKHPVLGFISSTTQVAEGIFERVNELNLENT